MKRTLYLLFLGVIILAAAPGCVSKKKFNQLMADKEALDKRLSETEAKVRDLDAQMKALMAERDQLMKDKESLQAQITELERKNGANATELASLKQQLATKEAALSKINEKLKVITDAFAAAGLQVIERDGRLYVQTSEPIRFTSGAFTIKRSMRDELDKIAGVLKNNPGVTLTVAGHTDDVPVSRGASYGSNYGLSVARANAVSRYLMKKGGQPGQLSVTGYGESMPANADMSDKKSARAENRRVEFLVGLTEVGAAYKAMKP